MEVEGDMWKGEGDVCKDEGDVCASEYVFLCV